jgi:AraC family transcriptional regulator of adaptative response / DNA-3-methyladenine glycosylase II
MRSETLTHVLPYRAPYDWPSLHGWLAARAIPGVEEVTASTYARTFRSGDASGIVRIHHRPDVAGFEVVVSIATGTRIDIIDVLGRVRRVLDLDRDLAAMDAHVARDTWLARLAARHPGLRIPGGWDPFELAVRAVLGQQVTIAAARQLATTLVGCCGTPLGDALATSSLRVVFPSAAQVAVASLDPLRMPGARKATLQALARTAEADLALFELTRPLADSVARLRGVKGIGEWTAQYIALRALRDTDAFPASDVGLLRGAARETGQRPTPAALLSRAEAWRPHRAYAAQLLWAEDGDA